MLDKPKILIVYEFFPPAVKSGGITRSLVNLIQFLKNDYDIYVFTGNKDLGDNLDLSVDTNVWITSTLGIKVYYANLEHLSFRQIKEILSIVNFEIVYINGIFNPKFSFYFLIVRKISKSLAKWVIAPRGMFQDGAFNKNCFIKRLYLKIWSMFNLIENITWHATDFIEIGAIQAHFNDLQEVLIASNIPTQNFNNMVSIPKEKGKLRLVYLSLISEKKNLLTVLEILHNINNEYEIVFDIYGPIKDFEYWQRCQALFKSSKSNLKISYKGEVNPAETELVYMDYHLFILLTKAENFGHSIFEALNAGTPVLISDKTPWRNLDFHKAGWDLDLNAIDLISGKLQEIADMSFVEYQSWRLGARALSEKFVIETDFKTQYMSLFKLEKLI